MKKVQEKFGTMPAGIPEFDHYSTSEYLMKNRDAVFASMPELDAALDRFENVFTQLNGILPAKTKAAAA
jgi:hypothetical protein